MRTTDGRDFIFAGAGVLWGGVQIYRGFKLWRHEQQRSRMSRECAVGILPMGRIEFPSMIVTGALFVVGCTGYMIWSILAD